MLWCLTRARLPYDISGRSVGCMHGFSGDERKRNGLKIWSNRNPLKDSERTLPFALYDYRHGHLKNSVVSIFILIVRKYQLCDEGIGLGIV